MTSPVIILDNVTKRYGSVNALESISLEIGKGDFFALLGPNGAGKTTIIRILLDFTRADSGITTVNGIDSTNPSARSSIGYVAENHRIPSYLSGKQYLERQADLLDIVKDEREKRIKDVLEKVDMVGRANDKVGGYSKGMVQRIGLAAALIVNPGILILDEPTSGLDPIGIRELRELLESLKPHGMTLLLNSHLLSEVEKICDSAAIINKGKILAKDTISNLVKDGEHLEDVFVRLVRR